MIRLYKTIPLIAALICLLGLTINHTSSAAAVDDIVYGDIIFDGEKPARMGLAAPFFPHWKHRIRYRCSVCHEKIFKMKRGANKMSLDLLKQGKFCGECHNGKEAFGIGFITCNRCHIKQAATKARP
ncbi:MAG: c(7)-type cytochrome triheme domain-containing protein [Gammaproteobacteria bacterium]